MKIEVELLVERGENGLEVKLDFGPILTLLSQVFQQMMANGDGDPSVSPSLSDDGNVFMSVKEPKPGDPAYGHTAEAGEAAVPSEGADEQAPVEPDAVKGDEIREEADGLEEEEPSVELPPLPGMPSVEGDDCCSDEGVEDEKSAEDGEKSE